jgi:hypothetical protein
MSVPPTASPWPAPSLADAATGALGTPMPMATPTPPAEDEAPRSRGRHHAAAARDAARRLVSPTLRAEHAALRQEQRIGDELNDLPAGWFVLSPSEITVLDGTIDGVEYVVIGPGGVFMIRVEHQPTANVWVSERAMTINGRTTTHLSEARFEARRAGGRLTKLCGFDVTVQSVLVLIGATVHTVSRPAEVHVRAQHDLHDWLCVQPVRFAVEAVAAIHRFAGQTALSSS